jgi:DNA/RNA endonuclease YhcR with UshA esterase domain
MRIIVAGLVAFATLATPALADTYTGTVSDTKHFHGGGIVVDLDGQYPNEKMALYVPPAEAATIGPIPTVGASVTATGTIKPYRGKPEIKIHKPDQWKW